MKRKPFSKSEHAKIGLRLKAVHEELLAISDNVLGRYGKASAAGRRAAESLATADALRSALDVQAGRDLGDEFETTVYYPGVAQ